MATSPESPRSALDLALSHGLPFTGLRDFEPDPRLWHYIPVTFAVANKVVPLLIVGDTLKIASADPDPDLTSLKARFPALAVDIVIAPEPEIDRVLERAQRT